MVDEMSLILLSVALFASTNLDDIFILVGLFASPSFRGRDVVIGQFLGIAGLTIASMALAATAVTVPREVVGMLGVAPIVIGVRAYRRATTERANDGSPTNPSGTGILTVALVTVANGGDNLAAYVPVLATRPLHAFAIIGVVFTVMTGACCWFAHFLVSHRKIGAPVRHYGGRVFPWVLVVIGLDVLWSSGLIRWIGHRTGLM